MKSSLKRLAAVAAVGAIGIVAPVASASAATTPLANPRLALPLPPFPAGGLGLPAGGLRPPAGGFPGFPGGPGSFVGPSVGGLAAVIGPTVITTAPSTFINTNIQVSAGSNLSGGQAE
jgi:hypothetical protein